MTAAIIIAGIVLSVVVVWLLGYIVSWNINRHHRGPQTRGEELLERVLPYRSQADRDAFERRWHERHGG